MKVGDNSKFTAIERTKPSFPLNKLLSRKLISGEVLDFGCGFGYDADYLNGQGFSCDKFDPNYFPDFPTKKYDTILCFYVLNVLEKEQQFKVLLQISQLLKPSGKAYFALRRDIKNDGFRMHKIHQVRTYQCNVVLPYESILVNDFCEIYSQTPINQLDNKSGECLFCKPSKDMHLICESASAYAIFDKFPVTEGHALIIPKRHVQSYFDLSLKEKTACWMMVDEVQKLLSNQFATDDFNVGINVGKHAGQTINHVHIHIIPRRLGDMENPEGGVRGVIPKKQKY